MRFLIPLILGGIVAFLLPEQTLQAQDRAQIMLILDASGSMWQRVENQEKILIARRVVSEILNDWDADTDLGVIVYGHRHKGNCDDIETVVPLGPVQRDAIIHTVNRIQPKGKTPLSAAVLKAARELRYTEDRATVILISDGKETCDKDPCAVGKELEKIGVDFTAHVIGFDITENEREQLQCLAEVTGGRYFAAREAEELKLALTEAVAQVKVQPEPVAVSLARLEAPDTAPMGSTVDVAWEGPDEKNDYIAVAEPNAADTKYVNYTYTSRGQPVELRLPDESGIFELRYVSGQSKTVLARRAIEVTPVTATLTAPAEVAAGKIIEVDWEGPDNKNDYLSVAAPDEKGNKYVNYTYTSRGSPARLQMPDEPGLYELRYVSGQSKTVLARRAIQIIPVSAQLKALDIVPTGERIRVEWQGPDNRNDYLAVAEPNSPSNKYIHYVYTQRGNPATLRMPEKPDYYELRYVTGQSKSVLTRRPIQVVPAENWSQVIVEAARGEIQLQALNAISGQPVLEGLQWTVYGLQGGGQDMHRTSEAQPRLSLPAGVYRANVILNGASQSIEFILNPGEKIDRSVLLKVMP